MRGGAGPGAGALTSGGRVGLGALRREVWTLRMERDTLKTFGHGAGRPTCWTRNSPRGYADRRPRGDSAMATPLVIVAL